MSPNTIIYDEPAELIIGKALAKGVRVSSRQLAEWHRAGLLPEPRREYPGGGGSCSVYPRGTIQQATACAQLMAKLDSKADVGWELWLRGFRVREDLWRAPFTKALQTFRDFLSTGFEDGEFTDKLETALSDLAGNSRLPKPLGQMRRRLGALGLKDGVALILSIVAGAYENPSNDKNSCEDDKSLVERLIGISTAKKKKTMAPAPLIADSGEQVLNRLQQMATALPGLKDADIFLAFQSDDFCRARDELRVLFGAFFAIRRMEQKTTGEVSGGAQLLSDVWTTARPERQALIILAWMLCRGIPDWRAGFDMLAAEIKKLSDAHTVAGEGSKD